MNIYPSIIIATTTSKQILQYI